VKSPEQVVIDLMNETHEQTEQRRKDNAERREEERSDTQEEMNDKGLCNSDFL